MISHGEAIRLRIESIGASARIYRGDPRSMLERMLDAARARASGRELEPDVRMTETRPTMNDRLLTPSVRKRAFGRERCYYFSAFLLRSRSRYPRDEKRTRSGKWSETERK